MTGLLLLPPPLPLVPSAAMLPELLPFLLGPALLLLPPPLRAGLAPLPRPSCLERGFAGLLFAALLLSAAAPPAAASSASPAASGNCTSKA